MVTKRVDVLVHSMESKEILHSCVLLIYCGGALSSSQEDFKIVNAGQVGRVSAIEDWWVGLEGILTSLNFIYII